MDSISVGAVSVIRERYMDHITVVCRYNVTGGTHFEDDSGEGRGIDYGLHFFLGYVWILLDFDSCFIGRLLGHKTHDLYGVTKDIIEINGKKHSRL